METIYRVYSGPKKKNLNLMMSQKPTIFLDEGKLDINFVPEKLVHREKELYLLSQLFLTLITNPNSTSKKVLITGKTGLGKTITVKAFGKILLGEREISLRELSEREIHSLRMKRKELKYVHINCRKELTSHKVLIKIVRSLVDDKFPKRGYSPQELLGIIIDDLKKNDYHVLIVLDELCYLISNREDLIYSLTRLNDDSLNNQQRISIIGIVRDISSLDEKFRSKIFQSKIFPIIELSNVIEFKSYSREDIFDILKYRARVSLIDNAISDDILDRITEFVYKKGDIRIGLKIMWKAAKIAEKKGLKHISVECINKMSKTLDELKAMFPKIWKKVYDAIKEGETNKEPTLVIYGRVKQVLTEAKIDKTIDLPIFEHWMTML